MKRVALMLILVIAAISVKRNKQSAPCADQITVICTTNPIPSIPSTDIIEQSMQSLELNAKLRNCKKIIVFDGIQPGYEELREEYEKYKENVAKLCSKSPYFHNTELIFCTEWVHLAGSIQAALQKVTTPFVFIHQHDFLLTKKIDLSALLETMDRHPEIKHVRLNAYKHNQPRKAWGTHFNYDGNVIRAFKRSAKIPLCKTFGWSDNDHIARVDYYREFVLPNCCFGAMEWFLHQAFKQKGELAHEEFGTYLYGDLDDGHYIKHLDGREAYHKQFLKKD